MEFGRVNRAKSLEASGASVRTDLAALRHVFQHTRTYHGRSGFGRVAALKASQQFRFVTSSSFDPFFFQNRLGQWRFIQDWRF